jgi:hypothetical protein
MTATLLWAIGPMFLSAEAPKTQSSALGSLLATPILEKDDAHRELRAFLYAHVPPLRTPGDAKMWDAEQQALRLRALDEVYLKDHDPGILKWKGGVEWLGTIETGKGYVIRKLRYEGYPGMWIPALLYEPAELKGKVPVVLNPNGHERDLGKAAKYKQLRCINLAKRGMIALNQEWIAMGELRLPGYDHYELAYLDLCGQAGVGVFYMLLKRGIDVLLDHPNADPERLAVTGLSGGGWQTIVISSLDTRVKLSAPNAGYSGQPPRIDVPGDTGDLEQTPCDLLTVCDYNHLTAMLAPRPALLIYNEKDNCCFATPRAKPSVYDPVVPFYELYGKRDRFELHNNKDPGTHNYEVDNRQAFYRFINKHFLPEDSRRDEEIPSEAEVLTKEQLTIGVPKDNANFYTLSAKLAAGLPHRPADECRDVQSLKAWNQDRREAVAKVLRFKPLAVTGTETRDIASDVYAAKALKLKLGPDWTVPAVELALKDKETKRVAVVVADGGRPGAEAIVGDLLKDRCRAIAMDMVFTGQCVPGSGFAPWAYAMMMANEGDRPLGVQVAQLIAVVDHAAKTYPEQPITVVGAGCVASVVAVLATALAEKSRPAMLVTVGLPASLKLLMEQHVGYTSAAPLFCFGLLKEADICEMLAMALPAKVKLVKTEGAKERIEKALAPFVRLAKESGQTDIDLHQDRYLP